MVLSPIPDRWRWLLDGSGSFSVISAQLATDKKFLICSYITTRWCSLVPIKINVVRWWLHLDKLHTRANLSSIGLYLSSIMCSFCDQELESVNHPFFGSPWPLIYCFFWVDGGILWYLLWSLCGIGLFGFALLGYLTVINSSWKPPFLLYGAIFGGFVMTVFLVEELLKRVWCFISYSLFSLDQF